MNDMERRKFEDSFKDAFQEAGVTPSENVWTNIELDLEKASGNKMKRRILFYKLLAAASVTFAMAAGGIGYYGMINDQQITLADRNATTQESTTKQSSNAADNNTATTQELTATSSPSPSSQEGNKNNIENPTLNSANNVTDAVAANNDESKDDKEGRNDPSQPATQGNNATTLAATKDGQKQHQRKLKPGTKTPTQSKGTPMERDLAATRNLKDSDQQNANDIAQTTSPTEMSAAVDTQRKLKQGSKTSGNRTSVVAENESAVVANNLKSKDNIPQHKEEVERTSTDNTVAENEIAVVTNNAKTNSNADQNGVQAAPTVADNASATGENKNMDAVKNLKSNAPDQGDNTAVVQPQYAATGSQGIGTASTLTGSESDQYVSIQNHKLPALTKEQKVVFVDPRKSSEADPFQLMMARLNDQERMMNETQKKKRADNKGETLWTSVGFSAGSFNTVNGRVSSSENNGFVVNSIANQQAKATGTAYSVGLSLGAKIAARWVVQGGVNYMSQSSDYTASGMIGTTDNSTFSVATMGQLESLFKEPESIQNAKYVPTASYGITSSLEFISVPVQAGYLVLNKKVGIQVNAGVSTDLFLQNTLAANGDGIKETTQGSGDESPYRTVNFSGLFGTEFSYRLGTHYRLALNPGVRYPLNSIYKSDVGIEATPLTFDVGVKFRYIFH